MKSRSRGDPRGSILFFFFSSPPMNPSQSEISFDLSCVAQSMKFSSDKVFEILSRRYAFDSNLYINDDTQSLCL